MDIVYFVKEGAYNPELIYSVRSACKNLKFRKIWFIGGCPKGILPDVSYPFNKISNIKTKNTAEMFKVVCRIEDITDDFIFFNDDFYVMKPMEELPARYYGKLEDKIAQMRLLYGDTRWTQLLNIANDALKEKDLTTYNFELHAPMVINKEKMANVIQKFPGIPCKRSLYGNYYKLYENGLEIPDGKIHSLNLDVVGLDIISTDDESFQKGVIGKRVRDAFPHPSKYEI